MTGFFCHDDYLKKISKLTDEQVGRLFRACMEYHATGTAPALDGIESLAFDFIREDIDSAEKAYAEKCETNRRNRLARTTTVNDGQRPLTTVDEEPKKVKRFTPPTLEEVKAYCTERGNSVDPETFIDFYSSKGWKVGNQPMKDWKAAVRTWEKSRGTVQKKVLPAQDFKQRDYSGVDAEQMKKLAKEMEEYMKGEGK